MQIIAIPCGPGMANSYIAWKEGSPTCAVIDPADAGLIYDRLQKEGLSCTHILLTHGHFDHVWGAADLRERTGAKVYIHAADGDMAAGKPSYFAAMSYGLKPCTADVFLREGDRIEAGGLTFRVLETPGEYSFESRMGCGFGACMGCSCETLAGPKRICRDGPVMESGELKWEN